ncbi:MAG: hypothetical protein LAT64_02470 [Phycisphaerales bacterium]|nr:hypothetical protein [Planctomycetota bacterium]MCH8507622.1 hypothetical protein [Phycisphaerales bacterium]
MNSQLIQLLILFSVPLMAAGVITMFWWAHRHQRTASRRTARSFRGNCGRCGYEPETGTRVCPECGGPVLDTRLFRPLSSDGSARNHPDSEPG